MFPKLRFKKFDGDWTAVTLESLAEVERGKFSVRPRNDPRYFGGEMPFIQTGDVTGSDVYLKGYTQTLNDDGIYASKIGDFYCEEKYTFEVGGKNKGFEQIKDLANSFVVSDNIEIGFGNKIPLWIFGFLY